MDLIQVAKDYGWIVAVGLWAMQVVWPQAFNLLSKERQAQLDAKLEALKSQAAEDMEERRAEREARVAERKFRHDIDERQVKAYEKLADAIQTMIQLLTTMNERINQLQAGQANQQAFLVTSVTEMRETVARMHSAPPKDLPKIG